MEDKVSLVIPSHNEESTPENAVEMSEKLEDFLDRDYEIIIVEDRCTDDTTKIAERINLNNDFVRHRHSEKRRGRAGAIKESFDISDESTIAFMHADISPPQHTSELITPFLEDNTDITTGSRIRENSEAERRFLREIASNVYNKLARSLLDSEIRDHQCSFKAFKKDAAEDIETENKHWFWDTEILIRAQREDYRIEEFPVNWESPGSFSGNLAQDSFKIGFKLFKLFTEIKSSKDENTGSK